jgi:hypothetical protein
MLAGEDRGEIHDRPDQCRAGDASDACDVGGGKVARPVHEGIDSAVVTALDGQLDRIGPESVDPMQCRGGSMRRDRAGPRVPQRGEQRLVIRDGNGGHPEGSAR